VSETSVWKAKRDERVEGKESGKEMRRVGSERRRQGSGEDSGKRSRSRYISVSSDSAGKPKKAKGSRGEGQEGSAKCEEPLRTKIRSGESWLHAAILDGGADSG
jgi:hypothetical protein